MENEIVSKLNWVDLVIFFVILRIVYISHKRGLAIELFKLAGLLFAIFLSFHYYPKVADMVHPVSMAVANFFDSVSLVVLFIFILVLFKFIRDAVFLMVKIHPVEGIDRWGGFFIGIFRSIVICSVILVVMQISVFTYLQDSAKEAFSNKYLGRIAPMVYAKIFDVAVSKYSPEEKINLLLFQAVGSKTLQQQKQEAVPQREVPPQL
ncbi:CvpA family protein [Candidatus Omnitrophota bacterium]